MSGSIRLTGMSSGLDTDSIVEELMNAYKKKTYASERNVYKTEYKIEAYREVTDKLSDFNNKYLDLLSSDNMKSATAFRQYTTKVTDSLGKETSAVTITNSSSAVAGSHTISVKQVADTAHINGLKATGLVKGSEITDFAALVGKTIEVTIDGKSKNITIGDSVTNAETLVADLNTKLFDAFGKGYDNINGKVQVSYENGLVFNTKNGASTISFYDGDNALNLLNTSSAITTTNSIDSMKNSFRETLTYTTDPDDTSENPVADQIRFSINGVDFQFDKDTTLKEIMTEVNNNEKAGVTLSYNAQSGKFKLETDNTGADEELKLSEDESGSNFLKAIGLVGSTQEEQNTIDADSRIKGQDTLAVVDGVKVARSTRAFTIDSVTYQANQVTGDETLNVNMEIDTEAIFEDIKGFIDDYNELVDFMQKKVNEEYDRDYYPLVDDERGEMTDTEIEKWDKKAKTGLLRNDSILQSLLTDLRTQFSGKVAGVEKSFSDIGIKTGTYTNGAKIILDDEGASKLKNAISNDLESVVALFTQKSTTYSANSSRTYTNEEKATRRNEEGLMNRFYDTLENYISSYRDNSGYKGKLLEKAGKVGDTTETTATLVKELKRNNEKWTQILDKMNDQYDRYYKQFSRLETAMSSLNSQSNYIAQMLGGGTQQ